MAVKTFDVSKLKPGNEVCIDSTFNMLGGCDYEAVIVENPSATDILGLPKKRQVVVREKNKRKRIVVDATWIRRTF